MTGIECGACQPWPYASAEAKLPHFVYRLYGADDRLVYVGCSFNPMGRIEQHRKSSWWAYQIARQRVTIFHDRQHALRMERAAIENESPRFNVKGRWQHRALWAASDYEDYYLAVTMTGNPETSYNSAHLARVRAEAKRRYGLEFDIEQSA